MKKIELSFIVFSTIFFFNNCDKDYSGLDFNASYKESAYISEGVTTGDNYQEYIENPFIKVNEQPVSTFSIDADGGAYSNMRRFFHEGTRPPKEAVRIEEFINYFTFDYKDPVGQENVAFDYEVSSCPWNEDHHILRVGLKGNSVPENELPNSNFVFLIDVSGSMKSDDKLGILKKGFKRLTDQLTQNDRIAIVVYAGKERVLLKSTSADNKQKIKNAIDKLGAGGSTAGAKGILTAYKIAEDNYIEGGNNRIILGSDGDFNVGISSTDELVKLIEEKRMSGIYFTVLGVGRGNLNDHMMEQIANNGNGNYEYIDNVAQIEKVFVHEKSKFITVAKDCKFQITFNGNMVNEYRLIGYENRILNEEDFEKDTVDAGELGAGQTITALYELSLNDVRNADKYATIDFRYKFPNQEQSRLMTEDVLTRPVAINGSSENQRFAVAVAGFGLVLRESKYKGNLNIQTIIGLANGALGIDPYGYRKECVSLMEEL